MAMSDFDNVSFAWPAEGTPWDGLPMARLGLRASFYFGDAYGPEVRQPLMNIVEQYVAFAGGRIQAYQRTGDRRRKQATAAKPVDLSSLQENVSRRGTPFAIEMSAEADASIASHWSLLAAADDSGLLLMHFPVGAFEGAAPHSFRNLFQKWCSELNAKHAYAGLGLVLPLSGQTLGAALLRCGPYAKRFVGLDVDDPGATANWCRDGIRTVNWLTAINEKWLERVGGEAEVLKAAGPDVSAMPYSQGSIFVAGASAQIGDAEQGNFPTAFAALGSAVAPLRSDLPTWLFNPPAGYEAPAGFVSKAGTRDAHHEELPALHYTKTWMARFDKKA